MNIKSLVVIATILIIFSSALPITRLNKTRKWLPKRYETSSSIAQVSSTYNTYNFSQLIDHFNYLATPDSNTFQMRYITNTTYWTPGSGPIFFYCGNEGDITQFWNNTGFVTDTLAQQFNALVVFAEHRYFGTSMPFGNASFDNANLVYLTTEQALADYILFLRTFKTQIINCTDCPVIAFGGSYGGMMASWIRMKFPNIVDGALAASAPILYFRNITSLEAFFEICTNDWNTTQTPQCADVIQEGFRRLTAYSNNFTAYNYLNGIIPLCQNLTQPSDISNYLEGFFENAYTYMCMTDYPYETDFLSLMPAYPVSYACWAFTGLNVSSPDEEIFSAMIKAANIYYDYTNQTNCIDIFQTYDVSNTSDMTQGWDVLACNEMVLPMSSNGIQDMFYPQPWNDTAYAESCNSSYGQIPRESWAINFYGGFDIDADFSSYSNIFFSNGNLDPWSAGGVLQNLSDSLVAYVINNSAHHLDLRLPNSADPISVTNVRAVEAAYIGQWIEERNNKNLEKEARKLKRSNAIEL